MGTSGHAAAATGNPLLVDRTNESPGRTILKSGTGATSTTPPGSIGAPNPLLQIEATGSEVDVAVMATGRWLGVLASASEPTGSAYSSYGGDYGYRSTVSNEADFVFAANRGGFVPKLPPLQRTDRHGQGELDMDGGGTVWLCVAGGTPGTWKRVAGPGPDGVTVPVRPKRVYDSRSAAPSPGALASGQNRTISVADGRNLETGVVDTPNLIPVGATAIFCNVTIADSGGGGFLTINPGGDTTIGSSTINWSGPNQVSANGVLLQLGAGRTVTVACGGGGSTNFILDVAGYVA